MVAFGIVLGGFLGHWGLGSRVSRVDLVVDGGEAWSANLVPRWVGGFWSPGGGLKMFTARGAQLPIVVSGISDLLRRSQDFFHIYSSSLLLPLCDVSSGSVFYPLYFI